MKPVLIIHGGAASKVPTPERAALRHQSLERITAKVFARLQRGLSALKAVELAAMMLEDDPLYNAGKGSTIQSDGVIRMSASIMDGAERRFGGCINVERVKNPIVLARLLMSEDDRVLEGKGAIRFARAAGLKFASPYTKEQLARFAERRSTKSGTIGALALDTRGRLAAATSTGGKGYEYPGRVSDSATIAGNFANRRCAVSATGTGEEIMEFAVAAGICANVAAGERLSGAATKLMRSARKAGATFGFIGLDSTGRSVAVTSTPHLVWASADSDGLTINP